MSQKVRIERVELTGTPFLGERRLDPDSDPIPVWATTADDAMEWLCDGWRSMFNTFRSRRSRRRCGELVPLGDTVDERTPSQCRHTSTWLAAIPNPVLKSAEKIESTDWFAATKRRATRVRNHRNPGKMPTFRSRKRDDQTFVCWHERGQSGQGWRNARFERYNRHHGAVIITGQNPATRRPASGSLGFEIRIRVRLSEPIRDYTSIRVNWTRKTLVFVNTTLPVRDAAANPSGEIGGGDLGCTVMLAVSDGTMHNPPPGIRDSIKTADTTIRRLQRSQNRAIAAAGHTSRRHYLSATGGGSAAWKRREAEIARLNARTSRQIADFQHKVSHQIAATFDQFALEALRLDAMSRKAAPKPDPLRPGHFLPNGQAAKRGLNRSLRAGCLGQLRTFIGYKLDLAGATLTLVPAPNTSRRCHQCGHIAADNRESQATFCCQSCGHTDNADLNAARNIRDLALGLWGRNQTQAGARPGAKTRPDIIRDQVADDAGSTKHEPLTPAA